MHNNQPIAPGASYDSEVKALIRAGSFIVKTGSDLRDLKVERVKVFGESTFMISDPHKDWGIATLETT